MKVANGTTLKTKRNTRMTADWYPVQNAQTLTAGGQVTFDFSNIQTLLSDAEKLGKRPSVHAVSIVIRHAYDLAAGGAGADAEVSDIQRGCFYTANWQQPNVKGKWFTGTTTLAEHRITGRIINPIATALDRLLPAKKKLFHRTDAGDSVTFVGSTIPSADVDKRVDPIAGFGDDENFQFVSAAAATPGLSFNDVFTLPMCSMSGPSSYENDKLPLRMLVDPNNPWRVTITERTIGALSIRTNMFRTTAHVVTAQVFVYISFADASSPHRIGVQWSSQPDNFNGDKILPAHWHRFYGLYPDFDSIVTDGGVLAMAVPYRPDDWQTFLTTNNVRVFDCGQQVFPLPTFSDAPRFLEHFNIGNSAGENPRLNFNPLAASTRINASASGLGGVVAGWYTANALGQWAGVPVMPLLTNHFAVAGYPVNVMAKPGCEANHRITVDGAAALPALSGSRARMIYVAEYDSDRDTAKAYSVTGRQDGDFSPTAWKPALDNIAAPTAMDSIDIVPHVLNP